MIRTRMLTLLLAAVVLVLSGLACDTADSLLCWINGGKLVPTSYHPDGLVDQSAYCDRSAPVGSGGDQITSEDPGSLDLPNTTLPLAECLVPNHSERWVYQNLTGEAGEFCNAEFVYHNKGAQRVSIIVQEVWDTNAQSGTKWSSLILDPDQEWTLRCSYAWRPDDPQGDTYHYVSRLMVVYYNPGCSWLTFDQEPLWDEVGMEILAPCH